MSLKASLHFQSLDRWIEDRIFLSMLEWGPFTPGGEEEAFPRVSGAEIIQKFRFLGYVLRM